MAESTDGNNREIIKEAVQRFVDAQLRGEKPNIDEFVKQYPDLENRIRDSIKDVQKIDDLFDSLVQADESDFENTVITQDFISQKLGDFEIVEMIGHGGMGVVYLAHDTKLERSVAIKSLPAELADDSTARMRFRREAKLLASLNHPNIAVIHDIIEEEKTGYLILEYVPGETLAQRIADKPLKLKEVLSISRQIAEALSAAHEKGVIHRDLKPANIKITPESRVKVLDFGLAKAVHSEPMVRQSTVTGIGKIMGTPTYMSPEQARGKSTDQRTDIWSFGCVLYEMLTGRLPFDGETATDILANIIEREPDWELLPKDTPANIRTLLRRCLEKDQNQRLQHIGDAVIEIRETLSLPARASRPTIPLKLRRIGMIVATIAIISVCVIAVRIMLVKQSRSSPKLIRLVVLPFDNLGPEEDEYFADGITDAIDARLGDIHRLAVISRKSAVQYKRTEKSNQIIGKELDVDYILEGTIQRERPSDPNSIVRIIPRLIRTSTDTQVWSGIYDNDMSNIFHMQSEVAERVAQALDIALLEPERQALASRPTENIEAYDYYLIGNQYSSRSFLENDYRIAIQMYEKAVRLDPKFALAYARLSETHITLYWHHPDKCEGCLEKAKQAVDKAFQLNPDLPEAHLALGHYYYHGHLDYDRALEHLTIARKSQPNNTQILSLIAYVQRRQGKFEQAVEGIKKAFDLAPRDQLLPYVIGETLLLMRRYQEAEHYFDRAISLAPDWPRTYAWKMQLYLLWEGDTKKAEAVLEQALKNIGSTEDMFITLWSVRLKMFDRRYSEALDQLSSWKQEAFTEQFYFIPTSQLYAQINGLMGNRQLEQTYYESARSLLESKIEEHPEDGRLHSSLGFVYAGLGRKEDAVREGELGVELLPVTKEAYKGIFRLDNLARIYVMIGEYDAAIEKLEFLLSIPSELTVSSLRLDPVWDPLRDHPRFNKLVEVGK